MICILIIIYLSTRLVNEKRTLSCQVPSERYTHRRIDFFCSHEQSFSVLIQMSESGRIKWKWETRRSKSIDKNRMHLCHCNLFQLQFATWIIYLRSPIWKSVICRMQFISGVWFVGRVNLPSLWCASSQCGKWPGMLSISKRNNTVSIAFADHLARLPKCDEKKERKSKRKIVAKHWTRSRTSFVIDESH